MKKLTPLQTKNLLLKGLRQAWPGVDFVVRIRKSEVLDVSWKNGPSEDAVRPIVGLFEEGHFDGMDDLYCYHDWSTVYQRDTWPARWRYGHATRDVSGKEWVDCEAIYEERHGPILEQQRSQHRFYTELREIARERAGGITRQPSPILDAFSVIPDGVSVSEYFAMEDRDELDDCVVAFQPERELSARRL